MAHPFQTFFQDKLINLATDLHPVVRIHRNYVETLHATSLNLGQSEHTILSILHEQYGFRTGILLGGAEE
jgi:hypothetical protein